MSCALVACCGASAVEQPERPAAERTPAAASATSEDVRRHVRMAHSSVGPGVLGRCGKDAAAVRKRHAATGRVVRSVSRLEALDLHHVADLHDILADTL